MHTKHVIMKLEVLDEHSTRPLHQKAVALKTQSISAILRAFFEKAKDDLRNTGKMPTVILPTSTAIADALNSDAINGISEAAMLHDIELLEKILKPV